MLLCISTNILVKLNCETKAGEACDPSLVGLAFAIRKLQNPLCAVFIGMNPKYSNHITNLIFK
jgi:hypothetical protein